MRNYLLLILFFVALTVMFVTVFVPKVELKNNVDQLNYTLYEVAQQVPDSATVYLLENDKSSGPELYYKAQFILTPRVVVPAGYEAIPAGAFFFSMGRAGSPAAHDPVGNDFKIYSGSDYYFTVSLFKKAK